VEFEPYATGISVGPVVEVETRRLAEKSPRKAGAERVALLSELKL